MPPTQRPQRPKQTCKGENTLRCYGTKTLTTDLRLLHHQHPRQSEEHPESILIDDENLLEDCLQAAGI